MIYGIEIDKNSPVSLTAQLISELRKKILASQLAAGERLCPSRQLAQELGVSRNTVITAYEQLIAEGYLDSRTGSGTYVAELENVHTGISPVRSTPKAGRKIEKSTGKKMILFDAGAPDISCFPIIQWSKALKEACLMSPASGFGYGPPSGESRLREALCEYLQRSKGIQCSPEQMIIVPGTSGGISLISKLFFGKDASVIMEDPSISFIRNIFACDGYRVQPVPVDSQGMRTNELWKLPAPKLIYTVPSHQFPTGAILPVVRKLELLRYARETGSYIIEDDYDSEFYYQGMPIQSLFNLDSNRTIYLGTFSKIFSPAIRLGYMILPSELIYGAIELTEQLNVRAETLSQLAMAYFINNRLLDRHIYKMKRHYAARRKFLIECLRNYFADKITISGENAGLHLMASFEADFTEEDFIRLYENGVIADCVEDFAMIKGHYKNKLLLGYGNLNPTQIETGVRLLKQSLNRYFV